MKFPSLILIIVYGALSLLHIASIIVDSQEGIYLTKPLLLSTLSGWFYSKVRKRQSKFSLLFLSGLIFSIFGDTLLMFVKHGSPHYFIAGLCFFLITHILYITAFVNYPGFKDGMIKNNKWLLIPFLIFFAGFTRYIWDELPAELKIPVIIYSIIILGMAASALNLHNKLPNGILLLSGAILFVISDALIALHKFKSPEASQVLFGISIMSTYLTGQYLLASGAVAANYQLPPDH